MKVKFISSVATGTWDDMVLSVLNQVKDSDTIIDLENSTRGPVSIESEYDVCFAGEDILRIVKESDQSYDGMLIGCFANPALSAAKELASIPVVGAGEAALILAQPLGERYGVIKPVDNSIAACWRSARSLGVASKLACIKSLDIPVLDLKNKEKVFKRAFGLVEEMIDQHSVDVVVLGCGSLDDIALEIEQKYNVPAVYSIHSGIKLLETYIRMGIKQSKRAYMYPREKEFKK